MSPVNLHLVGGEADPKKGSSTLKIILEDLKKAKKYTDTALLRVKKSSVNRRDLEVSFDDLTNMEDILWNIRNQMDTRGVGYLITRQLDDMLSDMNSSYSVSKIQLYLRILIKSQKLLDSPKAQEQEQVQEQVQNVYNGLRQLQRELNSLEYNLKQEMVK